VYQHITEYLIDGFTKFGFDKVIDYIITNYVMADDLCLHDETGSSIQRRVNQAKYLKIGETVPNIILSDTSGKRIDLSEINSDKVLILFYASWCPHCQSIIPKIRSIYKDKKRLEVLAISLDTNKFEWLNFIRDNNLNWLNVSDLKGWDSDVAESYYIYATPTMFLLDKDKKIIAKPLTFQELKLALNNNDN
jgi:peroxiredoxin